MEAQTKIKQNGAAVGPAFGFVKMPGCNHILFIFQDDTETQENLLYKKIPETVHKQSPKIYVITIHSSLDVVDIKMEVSMKITMVLEDEILIMK